MSEENTEFPAEYDQEKGVYKLKYPITEAGRTVEEVPLRRFTVDDLDASEKKTSEYQRVMYLIKKSSGLADDEFQMMDAQDARNIRDIVLTFL